MPSPILARADALMQRRRQNGSDDDVPVLTDAITPEEDDLPVLLEIALEIPTAIPPIPPAMADASPASPVAESEADAAPACLDLVPETPVDMEPISPAATDEFPAAPIAALPEESAAAFDAALCDIVAHELSRRIEQQITAELPRIIEAAVRDFLAERQMIAALQPRD